MTALPLNGLDARILKMPERPTRTTKKTPPKLFISLRDRTVGIKSADILFCKSDSNYTHFILKDGSTVLASKSLKYFQEILGDSLFIRCHASYLVNKDQIESIMKNNALLEIAGHFIPVSKSRKKGVKAIFQNL
ncbi:LytR/AlgR family response regulator transcription factor [Portibacter lacus]|uniref:HTH LytTR-type domain-containing protein n=1 Tax=Portibacter lacus TaxID=1099794 RepID=A0AA37SMX8_9BACT|nr:LytTR family DNA-binding domain-containing protein [Portibacter lacus]GLR15999.1 hypothetical protein GCM10007940_06140 [Portibacter lacus]